MKAGKKPKDSVFAVIPFAVTEVRKAKYYKVCLTSIP